MEHPYRYTRLVVIAALSLGACGDSNDNTDANAPTTPVTSGLQATPTTIDESPPPVAPASTASPTQARLPIEQIRLVAVHNSHQNNAQMDTFANEVDVRSGGTLTIAFHPEWRMDDLDFEAATVADVQAGEFDVGWLGARVFDQVGVDSFQALLAPLLVDSHDLQAAVFDAGIPEQMLRGLGDVGLAGIGVVPGPLRKLLGVSKPFTTPSDFIGTTIGYQDSALVGQTLTALGAAADIRKTGAALDGLDGSEQHLGSIVGNHYEEFADHVTANLNFWPRPSVIFMNADAFAALSSDHQAVLLDAAAAIVDDALDAARAEDSDSVPVLCEGMTFTTATDADIAALQSALRPIYDELAADPVTKAHLDAIAALKSRLSVPPDSAQCSPTVTDDEVWVKPGRYESANEFAMVISNSSITLRDPNGDIGFKGDYTVTGDVIDVSDGLDTVTAVWSFDGQQLVFTDVRPENSPFETLWEAHPWVLTDSE
jgi:TRAP-type C4-dicarboxylate transport system substrate-binding protein